MTLLMNVPTQVDEGVKDGEIDLANNSNDELTLKIESEHEQISAMSEEQKSKKQANASSLYSLLKKTLEDKGEYLLEGNEWNGEKELNVDEISSLTLHSFLLKAESLGKKITITKSTKIKISD